MSTTFSTTFDLDDLGADYFKSRYLTGFTFFGENGQPLEDDFYVDKLQDAFAKLQDLTGVSVLREVVVGEKHDYRVNDYSQYGFIQLFKIPCTSVSEVRAVYPTGQTVQAFPSDWLRLEVAHSILNLVPMSGSLSSISVGAGVDFVLMPLLFNGLGYLPHLWEVDYTAGFDPQAVPRLVVDAVCKLAAVSVFEIVSDLIQPIGVTSQSLSIDGMSQSKGYSMPAFKARVDRYNLDLFGPDGTGATSGVLAQIRNTYRGINFASV